MHDDRLQALVVFDAELQIGPPHDGRALTSYIHVVEAAVAERRAGTQILVWRDAPNLTRRYPICVEHEDLGRIDADLEVGRRRSSEPRVPAKACRSRHRVLADLELEVEAVVARSQRLHGAAAEGPSKATQLAPHRDRSRAPFDDRPRFVEAKSMYGRRWKVRLEPHFAVLRRDAAVRKAPRPRNHRVAAPIESRFACPRARFRQDPLDAGDDERDDPAAIRWVDPRDELVACQLDLLGHLAQPLQSRHLFAGDRNTEGNADC